MAQIDRHEAIVNCMVQMLKKQCTDPYMRGAIRSEDHDETALPSYGIIVSTESQSELMGTNEHDDIKYTCLISRIAHSLGNEDSARRLRFATDCRLLFHRKRIQCDDGCHLYSTVDFGKVTIPQAWAINNNSVIIIRVNSIVRESRERETE